MFITEIRQETRGECLIDYILRWVDMKKIHKEFRVCGCREERKKTKSEEDFYWIIKSMTKKDRFPLKRFLEKTDKLKTSKQ